MSFSVSQSLPLINMRTASSLRSNRMSLGAWRTSKSSLNRSQQSLSGGVPGSTKSIISTGSYKMPFEILEWPSNDDIRTKNRYKKSKKFKSYSCSLSTCLCFKGSLSIAHGPRRKNRFKLPLIDYFIQQLESQTGKIKPSNPALITKSRIYTYQDIHDISDQVANVLKSELEHKFTTNPEEDVVVAIAFSTREKWIITQLAILKIGCCFFPIDYVNFPPKRILDLVKTIRPVILLAADDSETLDKLKPVRDSDICSFKTIGDIWDQINSASSTERKEFQKKNRRRKSLLLRTDNLIKPLAIFYTAGISGPRGIRISNAALWNRLLWEWNTFPYKKHEVLISQSPLHDIESLGEIFTPLLAGMPIVISEFENNMDQLVLDMCQHKVTRVSIFPMLLDAILATITHYKDYCQGPVCFKYPLEHAKLWFCYRASLRTFNARQFFKSFSHSKPKLIQIHGVPETLNVMSYKVYKGFDSVKDYDYYQILPVGKPVPNTRIYICDSLLRPLQLGSFGMICVSGIQLPDGYTGSPLKSLNTIDKKKCADDMYKFILKTGDYGHMKLGKCLYHPELIVNGNADHEIIMNNQRVNTHEIHFHLKEIKEIRGCHVLVYRPRTVDQSLLAFAVTHYRHPITAPEIMERLRKDIPEYMMPIVILVDGIPVDRDFEVNKVDLIEKYYRDREHRRNFEDWDLLHLDSPLKVKAAKDLFEIMFDVTGKSKKTIACHMDWSVFKLRVRFDNLPFVLVRLKRTGYDFGFEEFIKAKDVRELIDIMAAKREVITKEQILECYASCKPEVICKKNHTEVIQFLSYSFSKHGGFGNPLFSTESRMQKEWDSHLKLLWDLIVQKPLSVAVRRLKDNKIVALSINIAMESKAQSEGWKPPYPLRYHFELLDRFDKFLKDYREKPKDDLIETVYIIIDPDNCKNYDEAVAILEKLFTKTTELAVNNGFTKHCLITFDYVIKSTAIEMFGYKLKSYRQINCFEAEDGSKPFKLAPDYYIGKFLAKPLPTKSSAQIAE